jgi:hypothetical protein
MILESRRLHRVVVVMYSQYLPAGALVQGAAHTLESIPRALPGKLLWSI